MTPKRKVGLAGQPHPTLKKNGIKVTSDPLSYSSVNMNPMKVRSELMPLSKVSLYENTR